MKLRVLRIARWVFWVLVLVGWLAEGLELAEATRSVVVFIRGFALLAGFACSHEESVLSIENPDTRGVQQLKISRWLMVVGFVVLLAVTLLMLMPGTSRTLIFLLHGIGLLIMLPPIIIVELLRRRSKKR